MGRLQLEVGGLLEAAAREHRDDPALVWGERRLSYGDLWQLTGTLGERLVALGAGRGDRVALLGRNSVDYAVALLTLMRWGFVAVPLNWRLSPAALAASAGRFSPRFLLHSAAFGDEARALAGEVDSLAALLGIDGQESDGDGPNQLPWGRPEAEDLFALISTGGTEGAPKGVEVTHGAVQASVTNALVVERMDSEEVVLVLPQMFHNPHFYLLPPLCMGAKLVIPDLESFDPELLLRTIAAERVTRFLGVATMMKYLSDAQRRLGADLSSLRQITYGGAPFAPAALRELAATFDCDFVQVYGQTETSVVVSSLGARDHLRALGDERHAHLLVSAGRTVPLMSARVLDDAGAEVPRDRDSVGEIVVQGPSLMRGYWEDEERTAAAFEDGWLRTGDLGRWDEDGYLYIAERRNDTIISGGENVYPQAVEAVLQRSPAVLEVCVVGSADELWGEVVTAVVVPAAGAEPSTEELTALCREHLAGYMCPRIVHLAAELPKNASGKIERGTVRDRFGAR